MDKVQKDSNFELLQYFIRRAEGSIDIVIDTTKLRIWARWLSL
jgi:hypothetical protein